jgi:uncharacterized protein YjiS (DUF1127 family)
VKENTHLSQEQKMQHTVKSFVKNLIARYISYKMYRQTVKELSAMTNKELSDIGINRGVIRDVALGLYREQEQNTNLRGWV